MITTTWEKGLAQGRIEGLRQSVRLLLEQRFGLLNPTTQQRLAAVPAERLEELLVAVYKGASLRELGLEEAPGAAAMGGNA